MAGRKGPPRNKSTVPSRGGPVQARLFYFHRDKNQIDLVIATMASSSALERSMTMIAWKAIAETEAVLGV